MGPICFFAGCPDLPLQREGLVPSAPEPRISSIPLHEQKMSFDIRFSTMQNNTPLPLPFETDRFQMVPASTRLSKWRPATIRYEVLHLFQFISNHQLGRGCPRTHVGN